MTEIILNVENLTLKDGETILLDNISFNVKKGERVGLIGASGSGKTLTALTTAGLKHRYQKAEGSIKIVGNEILGTPENVLAPIRKNHIAMIFQNPKNALNPLQTVEKILHKSLPDPNEEAIIKALGEVQLKPEVLSLRPHQLSGGQAQRLGIALALAKKPALLIADEPTTALDAITSESIIKLLLDRLEETDAGLLFISHDLPLVKRVCTRGLLVEKGRIVKDAPCSILEKTSEHHISPSTQNHLKTTGNTKPIIQVENISRVRPSRKHRSDEKRILDNINFTIFEGENVGIVGESGAGKSSLLRIIANLNKATSGKVRTSGTIQMVFQQPQGSFNPRIKLFTSLTEGMNDVNREVKREKVISILENINLDPEVIDLVPHQLSGGQLQRLAIARAVLSDADVILADEPVSAIDENARQMVLEVLKLATKDRGLLLVSHDFDPVIQLCNKVMVMKDGVIIESGLVEKILYSPDNIYTKKLVETARNNGQF